MGAGEVGPGRWGKGRWGKGWRTRNPKVPNKARPRTGVGDVALGGHWVLGAGAGIVSRLRRVLRLSWACCLCDIAVRHVRPGRVVEVPTAALPYRPS